MDPAVFFSALPTVVIAVVGFLLKRSIDNVDTKQKEMNSDLRALMVASGRAEIHSAQLEGRIVALERELFTRNRGT